MVDNLSLEGTLPHNYNSDSVDQRRLGELVDLFSTTRFTAEGPERARDLLGEVDEYFLFKDPGQRDEGDEDDEVEFSLVGSDNTIDLTDAIGAALITETPYVVLCKPDCKGLCPVCGANLNEEDCGHVAELERRRLEESPFAALKDLKLDDE